MWLCVTETGGIVDPYSHWVSLVWKPTHAYLQSFYWLLKSFQKWFWSMSQGSFIFLTNIKPEKLKYDWFLYFPKIFPTSQCMRINGKLDFGIATDAQCNHTAGCNILLHSICRTTFICDCYLVPCICISLWFVFVFSLNLQTNLHFYFYLVPCANGY